MFTVIQDRTERRAAKHRIVELLKDAGSGMVSAVPPDVLAQRLGWAPSCGGLVIKLVREIMVDQDDDVLLGICDDGVFYIQTREQRLEAARMMYGVLKDYRRICRRLCPSLEQAVQGKVF